MDAWAKILRDMKKGKELGTIEGDKAEAFERILSSVLNGLKIGRAQAEG